LERVLEERRYIDADEEASIERVLKMRAHKGGCGKHQFVNIRKDDEANVQSQRLRKLRN